VTTLALRPPLLRPRRAVLGGVCAALAVHLGWPVSRVRVLMLAAILLGGAGALLYLWLWTVAVAPGLAVVAAVFTAVVIVAAGTRADNLTTLGLVAATLASGAAVAWSLGFDRHDPTRSAAYGLWVRSLSSAFLLVAGAAVLLARPTALNAVLGVGVVVLGIAVLVAPRVVMLWSDLLRERATRVREEQRAEIAAHLHDSVLQTLALIQNRAGASSEVARIARAQERELRDWLFERDIPVADDLSTELRSIAAAIELDYAARIEVVAAGESVAGIPSLVAASREAMLNAARHAGGEVSVYLETSASAIDVFVRDRGPADLDALQSDRLGIRESIIGRMTRAGGTATVRPGAGGVGTEVHLHLEVLP
jgi:signal transduction histidine kinase